MDKQQFWWSNHSSCLLSHAEVYTRGSSILIRLTFPLVVRERLEGTRGLLVLVEVVGRRLVFVGEVSGGAQPAVHGVEAGLRLGVVGVHGRGDVRHLRVGQRERLHRLGHEVTAGGTAERLHGGEAIGGVGGRCCLVRGKGVRRLGRSLRVGVSGGRVSRAVTGGRGGDQVLQTEGVGV